MFPKLISIGSFFLPTYGVLVALAFLIGLLVTIRLARRSGMNADLITNLAIYCALAGLAGGKLFMILFDWSFFAEHPREIFTLSTLQAAGVFQGGLLLALLTAVLYIRHHKLPFLATADAFAPGVALGHAIGRLGCFAAGCCWGIECTRPWAITFTNPDAHRLVGVPIGIPVHPTQLYEMVTEAVVFAFLYLWYGRPHKPGVILALYLVLSSVARFVIEFYRFHEQGYLYGVPLSLTQWIAIGTFLLGAGMLVIQRPPKPAAAE